MLENDENFGTENIYFFVRKDFEVGKCFIVFRKNLLVHQSIFE